MRTSTTLPRSSRTSYLQLPNPPQNISLRLTEGGPALESDSALLGQNTAKSPLIVKVHLQPVVPPPPVVPSSGPLLKSHRQQSFRKMAVAASCRGFLDAVAGKLKYFYLFDARSKDPTIGDVLHARARNGHFKLFRRRIPYWTMKASQKQSKGELL